VPFVDQTEARNSDTGFRDRRFQPIRYHTTRHRGDETIEVWSALDALVLKATALILTPHWLPDFSPHCHHLPGRGGAKAAVRFVHEHLAANTFVFRTDVKSYCARWKIAWNVCPSFMSKVWT
jgi:hypothetical protein